MTALARLATGDAGAETLGMLEAALGPIADAWDCADFALVPLLWARLRYAAAIPAGLRERIDAAIAGYRYWLDEPGNDVQWYFSENHALLFHTAAYLAGSLLPEARFARSGRSGAEQSAVGRERVLGWLDHFERWEMAEFNSAPYFPIDLKGLTALFALAPDAEIRARAGRAIARLVEIVANSCHQGLLTAAQGRSYEHSLRPGAFARALGDRAAALEAGRLRRAVSRAAAARALPARPRARPARPRRPRALARQARAGVVLPPGRRRLRRALPLQDPRLRDGLRRRATAGSSGATRRRWSMPASAPSRRRRSGSTTPAS